MLLRLALVVVVVTRVVVVAVVIAGNSCWEYRNCICMLLPATVTNCDYLICGSCKCPRKMRVECRKLNHNNYVNFLVKLQPVVRGVPPTIHTTHNCNAEAHLLTCYLLAATCHTKLKQWPKNKKTLKFHFRLTDDALWLWQGR